MLGVATPLTAFDARGVADHSGSLAIASFYTSKIACADACAVSITEPGKEV